MPIDERTALDFPIGTMPVGAVSYDACGRSDMVSRNN